MLNRITISSLKTMQTSNGVAWSATVLLDGQPKARIENRGDGGCSSFYPVDGDYKAMRTFVAEATEAAHKALGRKSYEAFENLLSATSEGMTVAQAVTIWQAALAA